MDRRSFAGVMGACLTSIVGTFTLSIQGNQDGGELYLTGKYYEELPEDTSVVSENNEQISNNDVLSSFIDAVQTQFENKDPQTDSIHHRSVILREEISGGEYSAISDVMNKVAPDRRAGYGIFVSAGEYTFEIVMVGVD